MYENKPIITRFAPSPTGYLHIGGARTTLFNYLFTKQHGGKMLLRIEDTDKERSKPEYEKNILDGLAWLGLPFEGTPVRQSERTVIYKKYLEKMIAEGFAYISKEEAKEGGRAEVIRFKNTNQKIKFTDLIRGDIEFDTTELKDFVIAKSLEEPLYHLAVVVDDFEMNITHVIRGEDHISNTPRQILIQRAIGAPEPVYAHLPLILAPDRSKLSKRKHGEGVSLPYYRDHGYLPEAIINYLALLGWNPGTEQEIFSLEEIVANFDMNKVQKAGAIFNIEKLNWINREYLKKIAPETIEKQVFAGLIKIGIQNPPRETVTKIAPLLLDKISTLSEVETLIATGEVTYFFIKPEFGPEMLSWKGKSEPQKTKERLEKVLGLLTEVPEGTFSDTEVKNAIWDYAGTEGRGEVLWPTRVALSGREKSPDPFVLAQVLGKKETLERITSAIKKLE